MKDLSNYIESLLEGIKLDALKKPCEVKYTDNIYYVYIVYNYEDNPNLYRLSDMIIRKTVYKTECMLKKYLPENMFKVVGKKINVPNSLSHIDLW